MSVLVCHIYVHTHTHGILFNKRFTHDQRLPSCRLWLKRSYFDDDEYLESDLVDEKFTSLNIQGGLCWDIWKNTILGEK